MPAATLSFGGKLILFFKLTAIVIPAAGFNAIRAGLRAWLQRLSYRAALWNGFARAVMTYLTAHQIKALFPASIQTYRSWAKRAGQEPEIQTLSDGVTRLLWIGPKKAKKVVLFFHGGGYVMPLAKGHMGWMEYTRKEAIKAGLDLSVAVLEYQLLPEHPYPSQMNQAILAFKALLASGYAPSDIIFGGDSAGGHLSLSLLSHLHKPRPSDDGADTMIEMKNRLRGCFLVSPLVSLDLTTRSYGERCSADVLSPSAVRNCGILISRDGVWKKEIDNGQGWGMALAVPEKWWDGLNVVSNIMVTAGHEEIFRDHVVQLMDIFKRRTSVPITTHMALDEAHDGPLMDFDANRPPSAHTKAIVEWIVSSFSQKEEDYSFVQVN